MQDNEKKCVVCGKPLTGRKTKYCSHECKRLYYAQFYWSVLKSLILERDNYTCKACGRRHPEVQLEVHHVIPKRYGGTDSADNLITLCHECHRKTMHKKRNVVRAVEKAKSTPLTRFLTAEEARKP